MLTKQEITEFALDEIAKHGLACDLTWTKAKGYLGQATYQRYGDRLICTKISLSETWLAVLNDKYKMLDTVLHEVAHALAYERYNESCGHDHRWKAIAKEIGARPYACSFAGFDKHKMHTLQKYRADCERCDQKYFFNRMGKHWKNGSYRCGRCMGRLIITQQRQSDCRSVEQRST